MDRSAQLTQLHTSSPEVADRKNEMLNNESLVVDRSTYCVCRMPSSVHAKDPLWNVLPRVR